MRRLEAGVAACLMTRKPTNRPIHRPSAACGLAPLAGRTGLGARHHLVPVDGDAEIRQWPRSPSGAARGRAGNDDVLSPRAFDVDALDVHLTVPPATSRRVTFT
ncbi:hypothetical protein, partial [Nonomuraea aridisoli]|uniref:hypothetical protein n=1 Tax=Nonomuraea aridisoli TaxID=2070368 RepID=UPI0011B94195